MIRTPEEVEKHLKDVEEKDDSLFFNKAYTVESLKIELKYARELDKKDKEIAELKANSVSLDYIKLKKKEHEDEDDGDRWYCGAGCVLEDLIKQAEGE